MKKSVIIGIVIGIIILGVAIFFLLGLYDPNLQERCEKEYWPPEGCSVISDIERRELCEKCEKFIEIEVIVPADLAQLTFLDDASDPDFSPDASQIIFESGVSDIYVINTDGTGLIKIGSGNNPSWSPVDNRIIYRQDMPCCSLVLANLDDWENKVELASQIKEQGSWGPNGEKIAYTVPDGSESASIWVMNSDGSEKIRLTTDEDGFCMAPSFNHDGSKIVYLKGHTSYAVGGEEDAEPNEIWTMNIDSSNKQKIYAPGDSTQLLFQRAWNKDNKIIFMRTWYRGDYPQIWVINSDGSNPEVVVAGAPYAFGDPVWNNAGTKVACSKNAPSLEGDVGTFSY
ncbi:hypothetical protein KAR52_01275 [Candidatus Pacearchaeota archaeon]|nr:hypothetical protein [Candidatus Pacearchaeota archaeon]